MCQEKKEEEDWPALKINSIDTVTWLEDCIRKIKGWPITLQFYIYTFQLYIYIYIYAMVYNMTENIIHYVKQLLNVNV